MSGGIDPLFAPKDDGQTWVDVIRELRPWKCAGCGALYPNCVGNCECATTVIYREDGQKIVHETKLVSRTKTYDTKCYDLAETFLEDSPHLATAKRTEELAALIQTTIEDWLDHEQNNYEPPDPPGFEGGFADNY